MFSLTVISNAAPKGKGKDYTPTMPRGELKALTARLVNAPTLTDAATILRDAAQSLPQTKGTWGYYMLRLAVALETGRPVFKVFAKGNSKLPFFAFSALPQFTCPGAGDCLNWCYWFALLDSRPDLKAYGYSKSWRLLWDYAQTHTVPDNYVLNLSSGEREQGVTRDQMRSLPFVRGDFIALPIEYSGEKEGFERYSDPEYHRAVRKAAADRHACGQLALHLPIVIGIH